MRTNRHREPGIARLRVFFAVLVVVLAACASGAQTQTPPSVSTPVDSANSRPCSANPVLAPSNKGKHAPKTKHRLPPEPAPACLELKGGGIEVQEFLQNTAREQQWRVGENRASEDTWTFVRYFNSDELNKYADTNVLNEAVKFTSGKAAVLVRTSDSENGYVRVQVTAHFQGTTSPAPRLTRSTAFVTLRSLLFLSRYNLRQPRVGLPSGKTKFFPM